LLADWGRKGPRKDQALFVFDFFWPVDIKKTETALAMLTRITFWDPNRISPAKLRGAICSQHEAVGRDIGISNLDLILNLAVERFDCLD
jgi:hypothetical protein